MTRSVPGYGCVYPGTGVYSGMGVYLGTMGVLYAGMGIKCPLVWVCTQV